ncbi:MAG: hypothetical protein RSO15_17915, partial [Bacteroides sp.]|uniref:hypothetical protein n=1 Tax=Bacteroides sp. TaxID=29523 RepID=UPI002FCBC262
MVVPPPLVRKEKLGVSLLIASSNEVMLACLSALAVMTDMGMGERLICLFVPVAVTTTGSNSCDNSVLSDLAAPCANAAVTVHPASRTTNKHLFFIDVFWVNVLINDRPDPGKVWLSL